MRTVSRTRKPTAPPRRPSQAPTGRIPDAAPDPAREPAPDHAPERAAHRIYMHLGWWTLGRLPLMPVDLQWLVEAQIIALSRRLDAEPVAVRAASDRVRLLLRIKPGHSLASLVPRLKHGSQDALTRAGRGVHWASGFAAASVSADAVRDVVRRIGDLD